GNREVERLGAGIPRASLVSRFQESIEVLKRVWSDAPGGFQGKHFAIDWMSVNPLRVQRPRPPILVGAHRDAAVERAGRIGDGWIVSQRLGGSALLRSLELFRRASNEAGTSGMIVLTRAFYVARDRRKVEAVKNLIDQHARKKRDWEEGTLSADDVSTDAI